MTKPFDAPDFHAQTADEMSLPARFLWAQNTVKQFAKEGARFFAIGYDHKRGCVAVRGWEEEPHGVEFGFLMTYARADEQ